MRASAVRALFIHVRSYRSDRFCERAPVDHALRSEIPMVVDLRPDMDFNPALLSEGDLSRDVRF